MNLAGLDLNLLLVFDAVMSERHVTRAGRKIGMSQPAMSNALSRLRFHLKDELFVRGPDGMRPTPRALELAAPIRGALASLEVALDPAVFDPATATRVFSIGTNDYSVSTLMPDVVAKVEADAPGVSIRLVPSAGRTLELLDSQEIDFGLSAFGSIPERFGSLVLVEDTYVLMMREDHPLATGRLSLAKYAAARHLLMSPRGERQGFVDRVLAEQGLTRQIAMTINSFAAAPALLATTDLVMASPKRVADRFCKLHRLAMRPAPFSGPREFASATLVWHERLASHPAQIWFRELLRTVCARL
ncbi:MAG: LysR family transcriptional regulator [Pseudomonadota bacterium]